MNEYPSSK